MPLAGDDSPVHAREAAHARPLTSQQAAPTSATAAPRSPMRPTPLLAAVAAVAVIAGGSTVAADGVPSPAPASHPKAQVASSSYRLASTCLHGPGKVTLTLHRTTSGGTAARAVITGIRGRRWSSTPLFIPFHEGLSLLVPKPVEVRHHRIVQRQVSRRPWPAAADADFSSDQDDDFCEAQFYEYQHWRVFGYENAGAINPTTHTLSVGTTLGRHWKVRATVRTPHRRITRTKSLRFRPPTEGGPVATFHAFKNLDRYRRITLVFSNTHTGRHQTITFSRRR